MIFWAVHGYIAGFYYLLYLLSESGGQHRLAQTAAAQPWWDVLGVSPGASAEDIRAAYRRKAKATHPDSAPDGKGDVAGFRAATSAYRRGLERAGK